MQLGTTVTLPRDIDADLDRWLDPFLDATGRSTRRKMAPLYVRGLLGSGGRKGVLQNRVTPEAGLTRAEPASDTLTFSGVVRDGSMRWRSREAAGERSQGPGGSGVGAIGDDQRSFHPARGEPQIRLPAGEQGAARAG